MSGSNADREILQSMSAELPRQVLDNLLEGCQVIGADWTYRYLNDVAVVHARRDGRPSPRSRSTRGSTR